MDTRYNLNDEIVKYYEKSQKSSYALLLIILVSIAVNATLIVYDKQLNKSLDSILLLENQLESEDIDIYEEDQTIGLNQMKNLIKFTGIEFDSLTLEKDQVIITISQNTKKLEDTINKIETFAKGVKIVKINENTKGASVVIEVML